MKTFSTVPGTKERSKKILCPLCGFYEYNRIWDLNSYSFSKCPKCKLVYQNPQPIADDVEERYDQSYFNYEIENEESFLNLMLLGLKDVDFEPDKLDSDNRTLLDIGCATGLFLSYMKENGWNTYGVEVCESAADYGNRVRDVNIFKGTLHKAKFPDNFFDIVHFSHVIEHINDPNTFIKEVYRILKPGGYVYCTTPNIDGLQAKLFKEKWRSAIADHMILFSVKTLKSIFKNNGFSILKHRTWGGICAGSKFPVKIKKVADTLAKPLGFGDVVIISAKKK